MNSPGQEPRLERIAEMFGSMAQRGQVEETIEELHNLPNEHLSLQTPKKARFPSITEVNPHYFLQELPMLGKRIEGEIIRDQVLRVHKRINMAEFSTPTLGHRKTLTLSCDGREK